MFRLMSHLFQFRKLTRNNELPLNLVCLSVVWMKRDKATNVFAYTQINDKSRADAAIDIAEAHHFKWLAVLFSEIHNFSYRLLGVKNLCTIIEMTDLLFGLCVCVCCWIKPSDWLCEWVIKQYDVNEGFKMRNQKFIKSYCLLHSFLRWFQIIAGIQCIICTFNFKKNTRPFYYHISNWFYSTAVFTLV